MDIEGRWVATLILQLHLHVTPELVILCKHRYHRNLKKNLGSITDHNSAIRHTILIRADIRNIL
jgi:hypothetical protein